jgi:hypothetical protein
MAVNPFDALGLPARPDLTDEQVRAAWRAIAAATHPDRRDGGDVARYTAATADGGIWVMSTPYPEPLAALAGQRRVLQTAHELVGATWGDRGTTHQARAWTADPDLIRRLRVGQACYIHRGAATFVQVARPKASPLSLLPARVPVDLPAPRREAAPAVEPIPANLDDVLGPGRWP